jgi:hypothetical protein
MRRDGWTVQSPIAAKRSMRTRPAARSVRCRRRWQNPKSRRLCACVAGVVRWLVKSTRTHTTRQTRTLRRSVAMMMSQRSW